MKVLLPFLPRRFFGVTATIPAISEMAEKEGNVSPFENPFAA